MNLETAFGFLLAVNFAACRKKKVWRLDKFHLLITSLLNVHIGPLEHCVTSPPKKTSLAPQIRHIVAGGVAWFGCPCSSWVFMSLGFVVFPDYVFNHEYGQTKIDANHEEVWINSFLD